MQKQSTMRIALIAKAKHGELLEAMQKRGWNQRQLAGFLGISDRHLGRLINMRWVPQTFSDELESKLMELTGKSTEELFPEAFRTREFLKKQKVFQAIKELSPGQLAHSGVRCLPQITEAEKDLSEQILSVIARTLTCREADIFLSTVLGEAKGNELGTRYGITRSRVGQIFHRSQKKIKLVFENRRKG